MHWFDPCHRMLDVEYLIGEKVIQEGNRVVFDDQKDLWCACGQVCIPPLHP